MGDNTVTGMVLWDPLRLPGYSAYCYVNFDCVSGETGDLINMFFAIQSCLIVMTF